MMLAAVKPVNKHHPRTTNFVVFVERWSLFRSQILLELVIFTVTWYLLEGGLHSEMVCQADLTVLFHMLESSK